MSVFILALSGTSIIMAFAVAGVAIWIKAAIDGPGPKPTPSTFKCCACGSGPWDMGWSGPPGDECHLLCPNCSGAD